MAASEAKSSEAEPFPDAPAPDSCDGACEAEEEDGTIAPGDEEGIRACDEGTATELSRGRKCLHRISNRAFILRVLLSLLVIGFAFGTALLLTVTIFFLSGLGGRSGWHGNATASILIVCTAILLTFLLIIHCRRRRAVDCDDADPLTTREEFETALEDDSGSNAGEDRDTNAAKPFAVQVKWFILWILLPLTILLLVAAEVAIALAIPTTSIFPLRFIGVQDALASSPEGGGMIPSGCDVAGRMETVKHFFRNSTVLDFDRVAVVVSSVRQLPSSAQVIDETVFLRRDYCISYAVLVHELVHVWQFQSGWWFGQRGFHRMLDYVKDYRDCWECLYDYGGPDGLEGMYNLAMNGDIVAADISLAFGAEQMAEIVMHYYMYTEMGYGFWIDYYSADHYPWQSPSVRAYDALEFYARQIVES